MNYEDFYQTLQPLEKSTKDSLSSLLKLFKAISRETEIGNVKSLARDLNSMVETVAAVSSTLIDNHPSPFYSFSGNDLDSMILFSRS